MVLGLSAQNKLGRQTAGPTSRASDSAGLGGFENYTVFLQVPDGDDDAQSDHTLRTGG